MSEQIKEEQKTPALSPKVEDKELTDFLEGVNSPIHVTNIIADETSNKAYIVSDVDGIKKVEQITYEPFVWMRDISEFKNKFYKGDINWKYKAMEKHGITFKSLRTVDKEGVIVDRLNEGYKYLVKSSKSFQAIKDFFKEGGLGLWSKDKDDTKLFFNVNSNEQVMIQKGIKLFKGFEFYNDVHRLCFDIETTGLSALDKRVFMVGMSDNRGFDKVLTVEKEDDDESEKRIIIDFFNYIVDLKPSIVFGYNSENFDFNFFIVRAKILGIDLSKILTITRTKASLKLGQETEEYEQTGLFVDGEFYCNVIDTYHAVRRAKAINSDIKATGLKYITKHNKANKPNRMYVEGNDIYKIYKENLWYLINKENNEYVKVLDELQEFVGLEEEPTVLTNFKEKHPDKTDYIRGSKIVHQYLLDDLWETFKIDSIYNEATFMVAKWLSTSFPRTCSIGGASSWNLLMSDWSYKNNLAIPIPEKQKIEFVGGISATFMLGNLVNEKGSFIKKKDFSGLYPNTMLEYDIFPKTDITGMFRKLLEFMTSNRALYKKLAVIDPDPVLRNLYKVKQLPLKIFNNSLFGALGSIYCNWSEIRSSAERITCTGRQYLRKLTHFVYERGMQPAVCDTDGLNSVMPHLFEYDLDGNKLPEPVDASYFTYTDRYGKEYKKEDCFVPRYNDLMFCDYISVDDDGEWLNSLNLARKNYVSYEVEYDKKTMIKTAKLKMVGNSIKSSTMPKYIEDFLDTGIKHLIKNEPKEFVELYYNTFNKIYYNEIPAIDVASKIKIKMKVSNYIQKIHLPNLIKILFHETSHEGYLKKIGRKPKVTKKKIENQLDLFSTPEVKHTPIEYINKIPGYSFDKKIKYLLKYNHINSDVPSELSNLLKNYEDYNSFSEWYEHCVKTFNLMSEDGFNDFIQSIITPYFAIHGNKNGAVKSKQPHFELIIDNDLPHPDLGEVYYFVNTGIASNQANNKLDKDGNMYCQLIDKDDLDSIVKYNRDLYCDAFNKKVEPLTVCFKQYVGENLILKQETVTTIDSNGKKVKTKGFNPNNRKYFTDEEMVLTSWTYETYPYDKKDIDSLFEYKTEETEPKVVVEKKEEKPGGKGKKKVEESKVLFKMENREMRAWNRFQIDPSIIFEHFTCDIKYDKKDNYYDLYKRTRDILRKHNMNLKIEKQYHKEDDIVFRKIGDEYWVTVFKQGQYVKYQQIIDNL
jgi:DNA polymerase elongation subunit (family B)